MKKELGLWIDHRQAVIVTVAHKGSAEKEEIKHITSAMEKHVRFSGNSSEGSPEDQQDRRFEKHLHQYYAEVIAAIRDADSIWILGPGEAKGELEKRLADTKLNSRIVGIEPVDKLTEPQIVAKVREYFLK